MQDGRLAENYASCGVGSQRDGGNIRRQEEGRLGRAREASAHLPGGTQPQRVCAPYYYCYTVFQYREAVVTLVHITVMHPLAPHKLTQPFFLPVAVVSLVTCDTKSWHIFQDSFR